MHRTIRQSFTGGLMLLAGLGFLARQSAVAEEPIPDKIVFNRDIRPIFSNTCFKCHGPDENKRKAKLRFDEKENAYAPHKNGIPLVPGHPEKSEAYQRITAKDRDELMPPADSNLTLTPRQIQLIKKWIEQGADIQPHWAFAAPKVTSLPKVANQKWTLNPIDVFVLARLDQEKRSPNPEADRYTLVRRVYLDLIGLPPTPEEADAFVNDKSADAYEKLVDQLLASPHYGERWARRWLDLARYADTNGYEKDRDRNIWPYRDWVIRALNADLPFNEFTIEQLAGDLLPHATQDQLVATGFHRNTMLNEEGGIDPLEFRFHAVVDRVGTTATTWLGLTMACAQCHTHKYDPITHHEYYQTMAFLDNADEPDLDLVTPALEQQYQRNLEQAAKLLTQLPEKWPLDDVRWETPKLTKVTTEANETPKLLEDGSALFVAPGPEGDAYTLVFETNANPVDRLRLEALTDPSLPAQGPGRVKHGNFVLSEIIITAAPLSAPQTATAVKIVSAKTDTEQEGFPLASAFDGQLTTGWAVEDRRGNKPLNTPKTAVFQFDKPVGFAGGTRFTVKLEQRFGQNHTIGRVRLSLGASAANDRSEPERRREAMDKAFTDWLKRERDRTVAWTPLHPVEAKSNLPLLTVQPDQSVFVSGDISKSDLYELKFRADFYGVTAVRLEVLPDDRLPAHGPGMAYYEGPKGDFFLGEFQLFSDGKPAKFSRTSESYAKNNFGGNASALLATDGDPQTGWSCAGRSGEAHQAVFVLTEPLAQSGELTVKMQFGRHYACSLGRFRLSTTTHPRGADARDLSGEVEGLLRVPDAQLAVAQRQQLRDAFLLGAPELSGAAARIRQLRKRPEAQTTLVMRERPPENPRPTFLHHRGEFLQPEDRVQPGVLACLPPLPVGAPKNRLGFAQWLVAPENPLTARVTVNRQWAAFFGRGLVRTTENFGSQGEPPSHPELLDWLAVEFVKQGWSLKKLHKIIVMSATYRQSSRMTAERIAQDPQNRLLARGPRERLEAEQVRDAALRASGLLSEKMFGPPVRPAQPAGVTEVAFGNPSWNASPGEDRYRRSLYTFQKRTAPFAMFSTFDAPSGEACVARRDVSNTPLQSLTLLNDVAFVEIAQALGKLAAENKLSEEEKATLLFRRCLTRPPTREELDRLLAFYRQQHERLVKGELKADAIAGKGSGNTTERAAWTAVARALLNLDEMITKG